MKLNVGSLILIHGWIMLKSLESGQKYRVQSTPDYMGFATYEFTKPKGTKIVCRHYAHDLDPWIRITQDLNYVEIINEPAYENNTICPDALPKHHIPK